MFSIMLTLLWGFKAQMISSRRSTALYHTSIGTSVVCCMLKRRPFHSGYCTKAHSYSAVCYPTPTASNPLIQPIVACIINVSFLKGPVIREVQGGNQRVGTLLHPRWFLVRCSASSCCITAYWSNIHMLKSSPQHRNWQAKDSTSSHSWINKSSSHTHRTLYRCTTFRVQRLCIFVGIMQASPSHG